MDIEKNKKPWYNIPIKCRIIGGNMLDRITNSLIEQVKNDVELNISEETKLFEYFTNYCAACNENGTENLNIEELNTGNNNPGIDGIAIVVNGRYVYSTTDIDELIRINKTLKVKFILMQCKTSDSFDNTNMLNFFHFTKVFLERILMFFAVMK